MKYILSLFYLIFCLIMPDLTAHAEEIHLPDPDKTGGIPLMQALSKRHATRDFSDREISETTLSNLLWASWGVNRPNKRRVSPTAQNVQNVRLYVVLPSGIWLYQADKHILVKALKGDYREKFANAPVSFFYVAPADNYSGMHVGAIFQNAGLFAASEGLGNIVRSQKITDILDGLNLPNGYKMYITQSFGWLKDN